MTKQEKLLWSFMALLLVVLFLLSSTDLIIKEKKTDIYPVSIIISDTSDEYYANFRKGVDKAAEEYNVDVSFITLFEKGDDIQQMELLKREMDDGAAAVILAPAKPEACARPWMTWFLTARLLYLEICSPMNLSAAAFLLIMKMREKSLDKPLHQNILRLSRCGFLRKDLIMDTTERCTTD